MREGWRSLNGTWAFGFGAPGATGEGAGGRIPGRIRVPFAYQAPLSGVNRPDLLRERVWYRRTFRVPARWRGRRVLLHFGAVDWAANVFVNGRRVGGHRGGYSPFSLDVTGVLRPRGDQTLTVAVRDPARPSRGAYQPMGKQLAKGGIWYTRTTGIWQSVWLEPVAADHVRGLRLRPDLAMGRLVVEADTAGAADRLAVRVTRAGRTVAAGGDAVARGAARVELDVAGVQPWSPERPVLYDVAVRLRRGGRTVDAVASYTAFRTVSVRDGRVWLNGAPYLLKGVLDQGYWPDGILTAPSDAALRHDVAAAKAMGFNLARKHVKVEDPRWYHWADRLGLLVAQDMPASHALGWPGAEANFAREWGDLLRDLDPHPSVIMWIAFNEDWGHPTAAFQAAVVRRARAADPTRLVVDASGSVRREDSDLEDFHDYGDDLRRLSRRRPGRARWIGEYGGTFLRVPGHIWRDDLLLAPRRGRTALGLLQRYRLLTGQVNGAPGLAGFVYTQLTDVEHELNGLLTYDRLAKLPPTAIARVNATP